MVEAYLSIGSNLGDRAGLLKKGVEAINARKGISVRRVSPVYRTKPVGPIEQPDFFNAAVAIETSLRPEALLEALLQIERGFGRVRDRIWGPRTLDLDIILYGEETWKSPALEVPHPRALERAFVLKPLTDLIPKSSIGGVSMEAALDEVGLHGVDYLLDFERIQSVGVLGASANPARFAHRAQEMLMESGHSVYPISIRESEILGVSCRRSILDTEKLLDTVTLYLSPPRQIEVIDELVAARPGRVIFNPGTESVDSREKLDSARIPCIEACTLVMLRTNQF